MSMVPDFIDAVIFYINFCTVSGVFLNEFSQEQATLFSLGYSSV